MRNTKVRERLIKKYHLEDKTIEEITEILKERVTSITKKIERYEARCQQLRQNRQFNSSQRQFYQNLTSKFWKNIWENPKQHNTKANWIESTQSILNKQPMEDFDITADMAKHQVKKIKNWTAPGKGEVHSY